MFPLKPKIALCLCCKNVECKDRLDSSFLCSHKKMSKPTIPLPLSWGGKEWAWPRSVEAPHNTIHPDIIEDIAEAGSRPPRPRSLSTVQLVRNTSSIVLYYWSIVPALSTNELARPLWPADLPAPIVRAPSDGERGAGPLCRLQSGGHLTPSQWTPNTRACTLDRGQLR